MWGGRNLLFENSGIICFISRLLYFLRVNALENDLSVKQNVCMSCCSGHQFSLYFAQVSFQPGEHLDKRMTFSSQPASQHSQAYPKHPSSPTLIRLPLLHSPPATAGPETTSSPIGALFPTSPSPSPTRRISTLLTGEPKRLCPSPSSRL